MPRGHSSWPMRWQQSPLALFLAVLLGVGPLYAIVIYSQLHEVNQPLDLAGHAWEALGSSMFMVVVFGLLALAALFILNGETPLHLQLKPGSLTSDAGHALGLTVILSLSQWTYNALFMVGFDLEPPEALGDIARSLLADPVLMFVFMVPLIWVQAALFEEFTRVFALSRLFKIWPSMSARLIAILMMSLIFGLGHMYQGIFGIGGTALIAVILSLHYLRYGRVLPLIIAHGLYDTIAVLLTLYFYKQGIV